VVATAVDAKAGSSRVCGPVVLSQLVKKAAASVKNSIRFIVPSLVVSHFDTVSVASRRAVVCRENSSLGVGNDPPACVGRTTRV
jgi:hypothetical protein